MGEIVGDGSPSALYRSAHTLGLQLRPPFSENDVLHLAGCILLVRNRIDQARNRMRRESRGRLDEDGPMTSKKIALAAVFALSLGFGEPARASVIIDVSEFGVDLVFSYSGSLDTTGLIPSFMTNGAAFFVGNTNGGQTAIGFGIGPQLQGYEAPGLFSFSATSLFLDKFVGGIATGSGLSLFAGHTLGLPVGYISNTPLSGNLTLKNQSFDTLALIAGIYESHLPSGDFLRLTIDHSGIPPVPEPNALLLIFGGAVLEGLRRRLATMRQPV